MTTSTLLPPRKGLTKSEKMRQVLKKHGVKLSGPHSRHVAKLLLRQTPEGFDAKANLVMLQLVEQAKMDMPDDYPTFLGAFLRDARRVAFGR